LNPVLHTLDVFLLQDGRSSLETVHEGDLSPDEK